MADLEQVSAFAAYNKIKKPKPKKVKKTNAGSREKMDLIRKIVEETAKNLEPNKISKKAKKSLSNNNESLNIIPPTPNKIPKKHKNTIKESMDSTPQNKKSKKSKQSQIVENGNPEKVEFKGHKTDDEDISKEYKIEKDNIPIECNSSVLVVPNCTGLTPHKNTTKKRNSLTLETPKNDSVNDGKELFKWLINPLEVTTFFNKFWEKAPFLVQRNDDSFYSKLISFGMIDKMLLDNHVEFTKNIDITSYKEGIRETLNPEGRAMPGAVWEKYEEGCSIRLLNPQTFLPGIFTLNTTLQEYFHCMVGANVYLTPPNSQGFAPHYDDIEAFVLQVEGKKRWRLYNPRNKNEELPRTSSRNFAQDEIGEPILEKVLQPGDILYFPRGTIHQAYTEPGFHSLHITLSVYQKQSYADLFEKLLPMMLSKAIGEDVEFRKGVPLNIWSNLGVVFSDISSKERDQVFRNCRELLKKVVANLPIDEAVDQLAKKFQHEALPPDLTPAEKCRTVFGSKNILNERGQSVPEYEITMESRVRLLRANILRLVQEDDDQTRIYYYTDNSKEYQQYDPNFIEIDPDDATAVDVLVKCYPDYIYVKDLPLETEEKKICVTQALWERGILMLSDAV